LAEVGRFPELFVHPTRVFPYEQLPDLFAVHRRGMRGAGYLAFLSPFPDTLFGHIRGPPIQGWIPRKDWRRIAG
jgi:hypothetical protein